MDRPRSFVSPPACPITTDRGFHTNDLISSPLRAGVLVFIIVYFTLGISPDMWPFKRYYNVVTKNGDDAPMRRVIVSAIVASLVYYTKSYIR